MIAVDFTAPNDTTRLLLVGNNDGPGVFVLRFMLRAHDLKTASAHDTPLTSLSNARRYCLPRRKWR